MTRRKTCHSLAPSVRAASSRSRGMAASPAAITTIEKPAQTQMYAIMIAGVMRLAPSHDTPAYGCENVSAPIAARYVPGRDVVERERPVRLRLRRRPRARRPRLRSSTVTPGSPSSPCSTFPGVPPPGLKSLHTTPVIPPESASGTTACTASAGTSDARMPVSPSCATSPAASGFVRGRGSRSGCSSSASVDGSADGQDARRRHGILHDRDRGVDGALARVLLVHQPPDHSRREERDRHRHEHDDLEGDREPDPLEQDGEDEPDRRDERRHDQEPEEVVLDRRDERVVR